MECVWMNTADAQDILGLNNSSTKDDGLIPAGGLTDVDRKHKKSHRSDAYFKRPEGMHRELYNLLDRERNFAALMPTTTKNTGYCHQKARIGMRRVRPWEWTPFENAARADGLKLNHWKRTDKVDDVYPFARFNKVINVPTFTDEEYDKCLNSAKWSKVDTHHLFDLCRRFDLRWVIIVDRWEGSTRRTMEEMKERFYNAINELHTLRNDSAQVLYYDAEHEKRRKEQLIKQWNRTEQQIEEEEMLIAELKKIEVRKRERERKAQDLQKLITAGERTPASPSTSTTAVAPSSNIKKSHKSRLLKSSSVSNPSITASYIQDHSNLRFPEFRSAGAHLRSQEMKLPTNIGQKKLKNIETVIEKLKLDKGINKFLLHDILHNCTFHEDLVPFGVADIVKGYNEFRARIVLLQELKHSLHSAEFELESLRTRYNALTGKTFDIEPRMRVRTASESSVTDTTLLGTEGAPATSRTITDMIELTTSLPQTMRKRKAPSSSTSPSPVDNRRLRKS
uniref:DNA methyltransferase 1-associated protein 1 n=1 Tax=Setaria digitata TaxID=48799 RepID=A0A915Q6C5_9BILA